MFKRIVSVIFACTILLCATAWASTITSIHINQTTQVEDAIYIFFDAIDESGVPLSGLTAEDVALSIGAQEFTPSLRTTADSNLGVGYVFAVDISKSLSAKQFEDVRQAVNQWITGMGEKDYAAVLTFGETISILTDFTQDKSAIASIVGGLKPTDNKTQLYNGILKTLDVAKRQSADLPLRRVVVVLSDGVDDFPAGATMAEVTERVAQSDVPVFAIGVESKGNQGAINELGSVVRLSGGEMVLTKKDALTSGYDKVRERIQNGYVAGVLLTSDVANGSIQGLILTVMQNGIAVEDSVDVRLKAVAEQTAPAASSVPTPIPTAAITSTPAPVPVSVSKFINPMTLTIAACVLAAGILLALIIALVKRKQRKLQQEKVADIKRKKELDNLITYQPDSRRKGVSDDGTRSLDGNWTTDLDKTVALSPNGNMGRRLMLALSELNVAAPRQYAVPLQSQITVGRRAEGNAVVIDDKTISGKHCSFELEGDALYLKDLGSMNGTYLIDKKTAKQIEKNNKVMVKNGDVVRIGETELELTIFEA